MEKKTIALRMERQFLTKKANEDEYLTLYRDMQPGLNVYWNGFGQPPELSFRADFDDKEFNRDRQETRELVKLRLAGGNLGWIVEEDIELFAALYRKKLKPDENVEMILNLIRQLGPLNIQQIKEETGLLVKAITPALHKLQEAFLLYEDQYDGEWDRSWCRFEEMFPDVDLDRYTRHEALKIVLQRFAYRHVEFDAEMAKSYYRLPAKEVKAAINELLEEGILIESNGGYMLREDREILNAYVPQPMRFVYTVHRNDFLYKSNEHILKEKFKPLCENLEYDHEPLQYLLIDGEFRGASVGHFRNGPYDLNDVVCDLPDVQERREEILDAIQTVNFGKMPERFMGQKI